MQVWLDVRLEDVSRLGAPVSTQVRLRAHTHYSASRWTIWVLANKGSARLDSPALRWVDDFLQGHWPVLEECASMGELFVEVLTDTPAAIAVYSAAREE